MEPDSSAGGLQRIEFLGEEPRQQAGEHIAAAPAGHTGIAIEIDPDRLSRFRHEGAGALQHYDRSGEFSGLLRGGKPVALDGRRIRSEEAGEFAGMRRQDDRMRAVFDNLGLAFENGNGIRIEDERARRQ